jgi:hypothetical protein
MRMFVKSLPVWCCTFFLAISLSTMGQESQGNTGDKRNDSDLSRTEVTLTEFDKGNQVLPGNMAGLENVDLNMLTLRQMGQQNQATINHLSESLDPNRMMIMQVGNLNYSVIQQIGGNNALRLIQSGKLNSFSADYEGEFLKNTVIQSGELNVIEQTLQGSDMNFSIMQLGSGHELIQTEDGHGIGYKVTQTGKDMKIIINQGHVMTK